VMVSGNSWITWDYIKCIYLEHPWVNSLLFVHAHVYNRYKTEYIKPVAVSHC
jgi:hypothetical protein